MNTTIKYDREKNIVFVKCVGEIKIEEVRRAAISITELARKRSCKRFYVDYLETTLKDSTTEIFLFMEHLEKVGIARSDRIAIVYSVDEEQHRFAETVAHNRGWVNVRYFTDVKAANEWLFSSSELID